jgi:uncharacterized protein
MLMTKTQTPLSLTPGLARRLAVYKQRLAGPSPAPGTAGLLEVARDVRCVQLDPINAVDRTHRLVLFSRAGAYSQADLDKLLWHERYMFEYWAHCASLVLIEDYPLHFHLMRRYRGQVPGLSERTRNWVAENDKLRRYLVREIRRKGPIPSRELPEHGIDPKEWVSTGWTSGRNVSRMLDFLWMAGTIMVAGRAGGQKLWDLAERVLPGWTPRKRLPEARVTEQSVEHALRALGAATPRQIGFHFTRGRYPGLAKALASLEKAGRIARVEVRASPRSQPWPGQWYIHADDLPLAERLADGEWQPRSVLLSPFDNMICDRQRTQQLFGFNFSIEIYVPKHKRKYGYYVLPILDGDQLIGRIDPLMDRASGSLRVNAVYAEPGAPASRAAGKAAAGAIQELAAFLGATDIVYDSARVPSAWKKALLA